MTFDLHSMAWLLIITVITKGFNEPVVAYEPLFSLGKLQIFRPVRGVFQAFKNLKTVLKSCLLIMAAVQLASLLLSNSVTKYLN